jgi:hypothetical protein
MNNSLSAALIPYAPPKTPMEFIQFELEKQGVLNKVVLIQQNTPFSFHNLEVSNEVPSSKKLKGVDVVLPEEMDNLVEALFPLYRQIENQYLALPWPDKIQKIVVLTQVVGGRGDIAAATKAIAVMQRICPTLTFDWVLHDAKYNQYDPVSFLNCTDPSKVTARNWQSPPSDDTPGDFLLAGPVKLTLGIDYIESHISRKIAGPIFGFMENAEDSQSFYPQILPMVVEKLSNNENGEIYQNLHQMIFPNNKVRLPMGLEIGSGVFLDKSRIEAPLSRDYCCPSYLTQIMDIELRKDILEAMNVFDSDSQPNYDQYSFNSGYAHHAVSWGKFIDCVAIHEKDKHVVIVLNQRGEFSPLSTKEFQEQVLGEERLVFLKTKGYGNIIFKSQDQKAVHLQEVSDSRCLTVIIRPFFNPNDMKQIQLASERLLATGDNSAVEAWCARCKLYLYEDVANMGCKWRFLQQQVDLAQKISPNLSQLLALFGGEQRLSERFLNKSLNSKKMEEMEKLLSDPELSKATLEFCHQITSNFPFDDVLEAALKRTVWHYCIPELAKVETEALDEEFQTGLVTYLKNEETEEIEIHVGNLAKLGERVQETVQKYLS